MISNEESEKAIKSMKIGKEAGPGGLCLEFFKNGVVKICKLVTKFIECISSGDDITEEMKLGYITSIYKKRRPQTL